MKSENIKIVEIRDRATLIVALLLRMIPDGAREKFLFNESGYRDCNYSSILFISLSSPSFSARHSDDWPSVGRTFHVAHKWIEEHFDEIKDNQVIDVEFILNEVDKPCLSVRDELVEEELKKGKDKE